MEHKKPVKKWKATDIADFCLQIGTLTGAGVPLVKVLHIQVQDSVTKTYQKIVYEEILRLVRQGIALSDALEQCGVFPDLLVHMFRAAEESGSMDQTALRLAKHYEREHRLQGKINSISAYPKILAILLVLVTAFMLGFVLPSFSDLFGQMETLPLPTRILFYISGVATRHWLWLILLFLFCGMMLRIVLESPGIRFHMDWLRVHLPVFGKLLSTIYSARFARTLSSLYATGIPIVQALLVAKKTIGNAYIEAQFDTAIAGVRGGKSLSQAVDEIDGFLKKMTSSIRIGEETGSLDSMLNTISDTMEYDAEIAISKIITYLEPVLIIGMAVMIGFVLLAVMMPIYGSYDAIGQSVY
jgi:type IV pilus assembly protein PilC